MRKELDGVIEELMTESLVKGMALSIIDSEKEIFSKGFGSTGNINSPLVTPQTIFEGASLGKPLFSYVFLKKVLESKINLDIPLVQLSDFSNTKLSQLSKVTLRHLLTHTSGVRFSETNELIWNTESLGQFWQYSGLGYQILQYIAEKLFENPIAKIIEEEVLIPFNLKNTSFLPQGDSNLIFALGHDRSGNVLKRTQWNSVNISSSLHTTAEDYSKFIQAMLNTTDITINLMMQPQVLVDNSANLYWGLGWGIYKQENETVFLHWGSNPGFKSFAMGSIENQKGIVVLTNSDNGLEAITKLIPIVFDKEYPFLQFFMLHPDD